jgi:nucleotide-binding universal stress UspA family protein
MAFAYFSGMTNSKTPASRLVVVAGLDRSPNADRVFGSALAYVRGQPGAALHLVHVLELPMGQEPPAFPSFVEAGRLYLREMARRANDARDVRTTTHLNMGRPWREIIQLATDTKADVIVVGTHARSGISRLVMGSQAELIVRKASCPVLVVREKDYAAGDVPEILPPCPECVVVQEESGGAELWCTRHAMHHPKAHLHYEFATSFGVGSNLLRPD